MHSHQEAEDAPVLMYICQGRPRCTWDGIGAPERQMQNCPWCRVEKLEVNGFWTVVREPSLQ